MVDQREDVWLVTGGSGQLGAALTALAPPGVRFLLPDRGQLDLASTFDVAPLLASEGVTAIVNCAAYTAVDRAEQERDLAWNVNARAPAILARASAAAGIPIIQISTDYVFSGDKDGQYVEGDEPSPRSVYGETKLAGEHSVIASGARHAILRTAWLFGGGGANFLRTMLKLGSEREEISVVSDQLGSPTYTADLAVAVAGVTTAFTAGHSDSGVWHAAGQGEATWHGLAERIFESARRAGYRPPLIRPISSADWPTAARRPRNSRLSSAKLQRDFGITLLPWEDAVDRAVDTFIDNSAGVLR